MQTAITDLEERRDPRAKFERRCNEAFVALEKNDACQGRGDDHDDDDHDDDGIMDPNAFYLDGPDASTSFGTDQRPRVFGTCNHSIRSCLNSILMLIKFVDINIIPMTISIS